MHHGMMNHELADRCEKIAEYAVDGLARAIDEFFTDDHELNALIGEQLVNPLRLDIEDNDEDSDLLESLRGLIQTRAFAILTASEPIGSDDIEDML